MRLRSLLRIGPIAFALATIVATAHAEVPTALPKPVVSAPVAHVATPPKLVLRSSGLVPTGAGAHLYLANRRLAPRAEMLRASAKDVRASGDFDSLATTKYGTAGASSLTTLRAMNPRFEQLVVDPGTVTHLSEFRAFVEAHPDVKAGEPWAAREAFSKELGTQTVYRALALTPERYAKLEAKIGTQGLASDFKRFQPSQETAAVTPTLSLRKQIDQRVSGWGDQSDPLVSVAETPRVATSVAGAIARALDASPKVKDKGFQVYLFTMKVPKLDLVAEHPADPILPVSPEKAPQVLHISWTNAAGQPRTTSQPFATPKVESFVLYGVDPSEITHVETVPLDRAGTYAIDRSSAAAPTPAPPSAPAP